ncbi:MAG: UDP-N-acetylmuramoyl-tripeptide--D-alanyl-D-alanine ligase [Flavobacteriia bacterium]|jgi:UDP-N-acetylmuramoyl-tripeptide--D-alanyl-D-alanine ligase
MNKLFELFYDCNGISTDTRKIEKDSLFIALKGANFNGNTFAETAILLGAKYAIVDEIEFKVNEKIFVVDDALKYLQELGNYHRNKFKIPVIGITGSNGKTSTKELINAVLSTHYSVLCTKGNLNNHIGVPLTLLQLNKKHEIAIIEMGANKFKDIQELCDIASPTHGIITNIGKAHLEGFGGFEGVLKTKKELYDSVSNSQGTIVYNSDDEVLSNNLPSQVQIYSYGTVNSDISGNLTSLNPFVAFSYSHQEYVSPEIQTHLIGKYNFYNFLAAVTFGILFKVPYSKINSGIADYEPDNNRSQVKKTDKNTLILDCYNANPTSMKSALESFAMIDHSSKYFIIGDMLELGTETENEHLNIGRLLENLGIYGYTVGEEFMKVQSENFIGQFMNLEEATKFFRQQSFSESLIILKGSRGIGLENLETLF